MADISAKVREYSEKDQEMTEELSETPDIEETDFETEEEEPAASAPEPDPVAKRRHRRCGVVTLSLASEGVAYCMHCGRRAPLGEFEAV